MQYIIDLYRDSDPAVVSALESYFLDNGSAALDGLKLSYRDELDPGRKSLLKDMLCRYNKKSVIRALKEMAGQSKDDECCMLEAGYQVASLTDPALRRDDYMAAIMPMAMAVISEVSDARTAIENVNLLNHVFYNCCSFSAANPFDMSLDGSLLMNVIKMRKGSPFAISLIYFIIAQVAALPVYPLCFTGGFVPVYMENGKILFNINVFHKGEIFIENNISNMVKNQASALGVSVDIGEATVRKDTSIVVMYLEFLQMLYSNAGDSVTQMDIDDAIEALGGRRFLTIEEDDDNW